MPAIGSISDKLATEAEMPFDARVSAVSVYQMLAQTAAEHGARPALSFQLRSGPADPAETLTWQALQGRVAQAANLFRSLGIGEDDVVAMVLPNCTEAVVTLLGGMTAGIVNPINPLLAPEQIAAILRESGASVVVTLRSFPKTDVAQKVAEAVSHAPAVRHVLEVDLRRYLRPPLSWIVPLIRPRIQPHHTARIHDLTAELDSQPPALSFELTAQDRIAALFHTGGTTGMPKLARHAWRGMIYNGWCPAFQALGPTDVLMCPLPMFHVLAAYPALMSCLASGTHLVLPTPQGYRGEGVFDNFWKLIERYRVTFMVTVPTAVAALMQRPVNADVSSIKFAFSGSAAMPVELFTRFEAATGVRILEGYGMTETTCLISINPVIGERKVGSVGLPFPYTSLRITALADELDPEAERPPGEVGEICVANPGVRLGETYTEAARNAGMVVAGTFLRTGDLGRIDDDGFLWITGRAKDLIIRGGHNIDPAMIEDALLSHPAVAIAGAIGQPDARLGELPCAYVELVNDASVSESALLAHAASRIPERAAVPKHLEILSELPKTAVGKVFKPDLRKCAITRVFDAALHQAGCTARVISVIEDRQRGLIAHLTSDDAAAEQETVAQTLSDYTVQWRWAE